MGRIFIGTFVGLVLPLLALGVAVKAAEPQKALEPKKDASACMEMMQGAGITEEGRKAMRDFMQSDRAPKAMANMMEMMGSMGGGMMGGQGGMMR